MCCALRRYLNGTHIPAHIQIPDPLTRILSLLPWAATILRSWLRSSVRQARIPCSHVVMFSPNSIAAASRQSRRYAFLPFWREGALFFGVRRFSFTVSFLCASLPRREYGTDSLCSFLHLALQAKQIQAIVLPMLSCRVRRLRMKPPAVSTTKSNVQCHHHIRLPSAESDMDQIFQSPKANEIIDYCFAILVLTTLTWRFGPPQNFRHSELSRLIGIFQLISISLMRWPAWNLI